MKVVQARFSRDERARVLSRENDEHREGTPLRSDPDDVFDRARVGPSSELALGHAGFASIAATSPTTVERSVFVQHT